MLHSNGEKSVGYYLGKWHCYCACLIHSSLHRNPPGKPPTSALHPLIAEVAFQKFSLFGRGNIFIKFYGKTFWQRTHITYNVSKLSIEIMPNIRDISRYISKYIHMCNDRASTRFLAA
jgi:hypothetical protein